MADGGVILERLVGNLVHHPAHLREFRERVTDILREPWLHHRGAPVTLAAYLDALAAGGPAGGDEQEKVDQLTRRLLEALGYTAADIRYNSIMGGTAGQRGRPDYAVHLTGDAVNVPVFVVEDKATDVRDLQKKQPGRTGDESPVDQLRRYTRSGRVRGNAGLLCNGWALEAWQFGSKGDSRVVHLDLHALARCAVMDDGALPASLAGALNALWIRFSRESFAETLGGKPVLVPPDAEWAEKIREGFLESPRAGDLVVDQHLEAAWRNQALDVALEPQNLVATLRTLIDAFTDDVRHQLDDALSRAQVFETEIERLAQKKHLPQKRTALAGLRPLFDLSEEEFTRRVVAPVDGWLDSPRPGGVSKLVAEVRHELADHVVVANTADAVQHGLLAEAGEKRIETVSKADQQAARQKALTAVESHVRDICGRTVEERAERARLEVESAASVEALRAYRSWVDRVSSSVMVGANDDTLRAEFARQTAYVYIVRLLLVRICEDKGLFQRKLSDGGLVRWEELSGRYLDYASGRSYEYLTRMAYECAQNVYVHFYGASRVFDWYQMDEKMLFRAILALNGFNLARIDTDIIGTVYGQYLAEGKHAQGRYYTPLPLVQAMLDTMGYEGGRIMGRTLGDLACGSGSFLVEACRRLLAQYGEPGGRVPDGRLDVALEDVQRAFFGVDINPFACYLAETNLLIQVLDLVKRAQEAGQTFTIERFAIYSTDSLMVNQDLTLIPGAATGLFDKDEITPELAKARAGDFAGGFDFLIGNPPYVRADEKADHYLQYRRRVEEQPWFTTRHQKWDLFVPFVQQYHRLLSDEPDSRACLVTIESLATAPYAEKLRELLARQCTIHGLFFTEDLKLFTDASWQDNIVFCFSRGAPSGTHQIKRSISRKVDGGRLMFEDIDAVVQTDTAPGRLFNKRPEVVLDLKDTVPFDQICYVTVGMVLNSNEDLKDGTIVEVPQSYDPALFKETLVEDLGEQGKRIRHRPFTRDQLVADAPDAIHTRLTIGGREVLEGGIGHVQWLEYGRHTRCPARVRRPTFPELYSRTKIMFSTFVGIAVDDGSLGDFLVTPDSVRLGVRWIELDGVQNRALSDERRRLTEEKRYDPQASRGFSEWYLCALCLSEPIQKWLHANKRSMKDHVYPDDIKAIPIKRLPPDRQQPFIDLEKERHRLWSELKGLEGEGYKLGKNVEIPIFLLVDRFRQLHPKRRHLTLAQAAAAGLFQLDPGVANESLRGAKASGASIVLKKKAVGGAGDQVQQQAEVADVVARILSSLPATFAERQGIDKIPGSEEGLLALRAWLDEQKAAVAERQRRILEIGAELDRLAGALYRLKAKKTARGKA